MNFLLLSLPLFLQLSHCFSTTWKLPDPTSAAVARKALGETQTNFPEGLFLQEHEAQAATVKSISSEDFADARDPVFFQAVENKLRDLIAKYDKLNSEQHQILYLVLAELLSDGWTDMSQAMEVHMPKITKLLGNINTLFSEFEDLGGVLGRCALPDLVHCAASVSKERIRIIDLMSTLMDEVENPQQAILQQL